MVQVPFCQRAPPPIVQRSHAPGSAQVTNILAVRVGRLVIAGVPSGFFCFMVAAPKNRFTPGRTSPEISNSIPLALTPSVP